MDLGLKGKVAVITGGSVGIGLAVAEGRATEGVDIVIAARGVERVRSEASRIAKSFGVRAEGLACDVAKREGTDDLIADVKRLFGGADILINNAGTGSNETVMEAPDEKWQAYWDLHVMAAGRLARGPPPVEKGARRGLISPNPPIRPRPAALVRADLQCDQGGADDVLEDAFDRTYRRQYPRRLRQSRPDPDAGLAQDRKTAHR